MSREKLFINDLSNSMNISLTKPNIFMNQLSIKYHGFVKKHYGAHSKLRIEICGGFETPSRERQGGNPSTKKVERRVKVQPI